MISAKVIIKGHVLDVEADFDGGEFHDPVIKLGNREAKNSEAICERYEDIINLALTEATLWT